MRGLSKYQIFRVTCITILWFLVVWLVVTSQPVTPWIVFMVITSGIVVFVPLYKRYIKQNKDEQHNGIKRKRRR